MTFAARALGAIALLALATPALPCGDHAAKTTTAAADKADKKASTVAKTDKKGAKTSKSAGEAKPAAAAN